MPTEAVAIVTRHSQAPMDVEDLLVDDPGPDEVLVRVQANGLCHSDLSAWGGRDPSRFPMLMGHETAGVIEQVGPGVPASRVGEHVILAWRAPCGRCPSCVHARPNLCTSTLVAGPRLHAKRDNLELKRMLGIGGLASYTVVHAAQAIPYPAEVPAEHACLIGCGVMTGLGAAIYTADVQPGSTVAVFGCGGVGTSAIQGARLARAARIIAVDLDPRKLDWAREFGATDFVDASQGDTVQQIKDLTGGRGADYTLEAVGASQTIEQAVASTAFGGTAVIIGVPRPGATVTFGLEQLFRSRLTLKSSAYGDCIPARDFPLLIDWYQRGELKLQELVTGTIPLDQTREGFAALERGEALRTVVLF